MNYDPLSDVSDAPLAINEDILRQLEAISQTHRFDDLPGAAAADERERLYQILDQLVSELLASIEGNPSKLWVLSQFQRSLRLVEHEDTEARERFGAALEAIMDVLGIESSDGLLAAYLGGI